MTATQDRQIHRGTALFSYGFRPFFLFGAVWAALAMDLWIAQLGGFVTLPTRLDPVSWHAHAVLFGYLSAIIAGFLLTAVPNWTGRAPLSGPPLATLFSLWVAGRIAIVFSAMLPLGLAEITVILFPITLAAIVLREIITSKNWRNLIIVALLGVFTVANLLFHLETAQGGIAAQGVGLRLGIATILMMIGIVGGRIVPAFTRNWMVKAGQTTLPSPPMQRFDKVALLVSIVALGIWVVQPDARHSGFALIGMGLLHTIRLARWQGHRTLSNPLLAVLHLGYLFIPLGALIEGAAIVRPDLLAPGSAQHVWMAGGFALMTLAVMTRATLGHTGQKLQASAGTMMVFVCVIGATAMRLAGAIWPDIALALYTLSAVLWVAAFGGFCVRFYPNLTQR